MTDETFYNLFLDALEKQSLDIYIKECVGGEWLKEISGDTNEAVLILKCIYRAAHMTIREMIIETGLTQKAFATKFCVPLRTVQDWARGVRHCPAYVRLLFVKQLSRTDPIEGLL